jgi:hypothetical protein
VSKKPQKRRPEIMHPGLKQLTPYEKQVVMTHGIKILEMWKELYSRNKWKPAK